MRAWCLCFLALPLGFGDLPPEENGPNRFASAVSQAKPAGDAGAKVTRRDNGGVVKLKVGEELTVQLPGHLGAGYAWKVDSFDNSALWRDTEKEKEKKRHPDRPSRPGGEEMVYFFFQARKAVDFDLKFREVSPFRRENAPQERDRFTIKVSIQGA
jgi:hypothetical protein